MVKGRADQLPIRNDSVDAAAALYVLYHLDDPLVAIKEAARVIRRGGLVAVCAPKAITIRLSLLSILLLKRRLRDAEIASELMRSVFPEIEVEQ